MADYFATYTTEGGIQLPFSRMSVYWNSIGLADPISQSDLNTYLPNVLLNNFQELQANGCFSKIPFNAVRAVRLWVNDSDFLYSTVPFRRNSSNYEQLQQQINNSELYTRTDFIREDVGDCGQQYLELVQAE